MLRLTKASDESHSDEAIWPSYCLLFRASSDSITSILSYLSMENIRRLDIAVTNTAVRVIWLIILRVTNHRAISNHRHSNESIRWLVERGISPEHLETSDKGSIACRINGSTLLGLSISSLRSIRLYQCNIGDKDVLHLANSCPNLSEIRLCNCHDITDASMIALGRCCRQLVFVDVGGCKSITDEGLTAYADACCNASEIGNGPALKGISLSHCRRFTLFTGRNYLR